MYEAFYGLSSPPFQLNPDPAFYFNSRGHGHALAYLRYGVSQGEGFIIVTGDIGAGKTTLVRTLLDELDRKQVVAAQIVSTQLDSGDLLQAIITAFGIPSHGNSKAYTIATLEAFLTTLAAQGRRALLIVDEAQNLNPGAVEELRMLSNFQLGNHSLLQSFLVGQPELRRILEMPTMEQLRQRVSASCHLGPLDADETRAYIQHRLQRVGWNGRPSFSGAAFDELYRWSGGVPRRINRLANRVMLAAFLETRESIDTLLVETTARELRNEIGEVGSDPAVVLPRPEKIIEPTGSAAQVAEPQPVTVAVPVMPPADPAPAASSTDAPPHADMAAAPVVQVSTQPGAAALVDSPQPDSPPDDSPLLDSTAAAVAEDVASTNALLASLELDLAGDGDAAAPDETAIDPSPQAETAARANLPVLRGASEIVRIDNHAPLSLRGALIMLTDDAATALKLAAVGRSLANQVSGDSDLALVLVNPGTWQDVWPWDDMERVLPRPALSFHLGVPRGHLEQTAPLLFEGFGQVMNEVEPCGLLVAGHSDALLACALLAYKRGVPVATLETGDGSHQLQPNHRLIDAMAQHRFACVSPGEPAQLADGLASEARSEVHVVAGSLLADLCAAIEPAVTTPTGACLRNNLSIYLGPDWSSEVQGTPYAAVGMSLSGSLSVSAADNAARIEALLACGGAPKLLWLVDATTEAALRAWQAEAGELADKLFVVDEALSRDDARYRRQLASATLLSCQVASLPDQFSLLRGALAVISEPGHLLGEVAQLWHLPCALLDAQGNWSVTPALRAEARADLADASQPDTRAHGATADESAAGTALPAQSLDGWLAAIARAGYAARAAHAVISAAAGTRHNQTISATSALSDADAPDAASRTGAADVLAHALGTWSGALRPSTGKQSAPALTIGDTDPTPVSARAGSSDRPSGARSQQAGRLSSAGPGRTRGRRKSRGLRVPHPRR
ncbi:MAG: AAA family ATPase [Burkholderiales bacterium]|nr:AAA family ATPase [Burkholderiales bacterium]